MSSRHFTRVAARASVRARAFFFSFARPPAAAAAAHATGGTGFVPNALSIASYPCVITQYSS